jgi:hypothetical protein
MSTPTSVRPISSAATRDVPQAAQIPTCSEQVGGRNVSLLFLHYATLPTSSETPRKVAEVISYVRKHEPLVHQF